MTYRGWINKQSDMSCIPLKTFPNLSKDNLRAYGMVPSAISSKSRPQNEESGKGKTPKLTSKRQKFNKVSDFILSTLDLNMEPVNNKLYNNLQLMHKTSTKKNITKKVRSNQQNLPTVGTLLRQKEVTANAYNYNCEFKRLTQLFGRTLEMKYFKKQHDSNQTNGVN